MNAIHATTSFKYNLICILLFLLNRVTSLTDLTNATLEKKLEHSALNASQESTTTKNSADTFLVPKHSALKTGHESHLITVTTPTPNNSIETMLVAVLSCLMVVGVMGGLLVIGQ